MILSFAGGVQTGAALGAGPLELLAGRLHPLLVHFPIALLIAAASLEILAALRRAPRRSPSGSVCLTLGLVSAAAAAGSGWLLAANEIAGGSERLELHRWSGVGTLLMGTLAWLVGLACRTAPEAAVLRFYRAAVVATALLVGLAGHVGSSLVWGPGWLTDPWRRPPSTERAPSTERERGLEARAQPAGAPGSPAEPPAAQAAAVEGPAAPAAPEESPAAPAAPTRTAATPLAATAPELGALAGGAAASSAVDFHREVRPILERSCVECHGAVTSKGRLRLDAREHALGRRARGAVIVPGDPEASELLRRVLLPAEDPDVMPPEGERLSAADTDVLRRWIAEGASWPDDAPAPPTPPAPARPSERAEPSGPAPDPARVEAAYAALLATGARAMPLAQDHPGLDVSLARLGGEPLAAALVLLPELGPRLRRLDLSGTAVGDGDLSGLGRCVELEHLRLDDTAVGDASLAGLAALPRLRVLNLVGTAVGDGGLARLASAASLERVYVWRSAVTEAGARALVQARPGMRVIGRGSHPDADPDAGADAELAAASSSLLPEPDEELLTLLRARGALAQRVALDERAVEVSFRVPGPKAGDPDLAALAGLESNLVWLDLGGTAVSDEGLATLAAFARLERLSLERTGIGDAGLAALAGLPRLRTLNLFGTRVGDGAVETLASFPALARLYVWGSALSAGGAADLIARRPELELVGAPPLPE